MIQKTNYGQFFSLLILAVFSVVNISAQKTGKGKITGKVIDSSSKSPIDFATITIFRPGSKTPVNGGSADPKGNFTVDKLDPGEYSVVVSFLGYSDKSLEHVMISSSNNATSIGTVLLTGSASELATVVVKGKAPVIESKIDKLIYNAANDLTAQGGAAIDVLKKVPMVTVDIDGNVELQGNAGIRFLINGKPSSIFGASLADALQSIPASQIKQIEVITSPGAKYDAQGTGGIINIVLKDNKFQGFNGSVNGTLGTRVENGSVNLNARTGKVGIGVSFSGNNQPNTKTVNTSNRTSFNNGKDTSGKFLQDGYTTANRGGYRYGLNFNWDITKNDQFNVSFDNSHSGNNRIGQTNQDQRIYGISGESRLVSNRNSVSHGDFNSKDISVAYRKTFKKEGQELSVLYSGSYGTNAFRASQTTAYSSGGLLPSGINSYSPGKENETEMSLDYVHPVSKSLTVETGLKYVIDQIGNNVFTDTLLTSGNYAKNANQTYSFNYGRNVYAAYLSTSFGVFKNFISGKAGLRYERTTAATGLTGGSAPGYNTFAPSVTIQHKLGNSRSIKLSYSYRIERPDFGDLNPFYDISDPHNISTGNPYLKPEIGHNYELGYNMPLLSEGNIYVAAFYRNSVDNIQGISTYYEVLNVNGTDYSAVSLSNRFNLGSQKNIGVSVSASAPIVEGLNLRSNINLGQRSSSTPGLTTVNAFAYRVNLNASYQFPKDLMAEVFGNYNSVQKNIQSTRPAFFTYNLAVRKLFMKKNASIGLTAANPFAYYIRQKQNQFGSNFVQESLRLVPSQSFGVTVSYKFGKLKFDRDKENGNPQLPDLGN